ncbi:MAG: hypothetical protein AAFX99_23010, partial [Myxococcota bacterium]
MSLIYPKEVPVKEVRSWADIGELRIGAKLQAADGQTYKLFRQSDPSTITLQDVTDGRKTLVAQGVREVMPALASQLGLPSWFDFRLLQAWDFSLEYNRSARSAGSLPGDSEARQLVEMYRA